jgi:hypothetical protein
VSEKQRRAQNALLYLIGTVLTERGQKITQYRYKEKRKSLSLRLMIADAAVRGCSFVDFAARYLEHKEGAPLASSSRPNQMTAKSSTIPTPIACHVKLVHCPRFTITAL